jgi:hypothetical protein
VQRLRSGMDSPWRVFGSRPVIGQVGYTHAGLRRRVHYRQVFRLCLEVVLLEDGEHTRLECRAGLHPLVALFTVGWFGLLVAAVGLFTLFAIAGGLLEHFWPLVLAPAALLALLAVVFLGGRNRAEEDQAVLINYVASRTDAEPACRPCA